MSVSLQKGQKVNLSKEHAGLAKVIVGLGWDEAWEITTKTCAYTNHTIMAEALEKWPIEIFSRLLPRIYQIVEEINRRFILEIEKKYPGNQEKVCLLYTSDAADE